MRILLIGFGKVNKCLYEFVKDDVVGIVTENEENIYGIPDIIIDFSHPNSLDNDLFVYDTFIPPFYSMRC